MKGCGGPLPTFLKQVDINTLCIIAQPGRDAGEGVVGEKGKDHHTRIAEIRQKTRCVVAQNVRCVKLLKMQALPETAFGQDHLTRD